MLIVYGATAGVSVVQLYAGAFFPGIMLAGLYIVYVIILAKLKPALAPPLSAEARFIELPPMTQRISDAVSNRALPALLTALKGSRNAGVPSDYILKQLGITLLPAIVFALVAPLAACAGDPPGSPYDDDFALSSEDPLFDGAPDNDTLLPKRLSARVFEAFR